MRQLRAVLFDWRGTLAVMMTRREWVEAAFRQLGRDASAGETERAVEAIVAARADPAMRREWKRIDCDAGFHRETYDRLFAAAGIDAQLAAALYEIDSDPRHNPFANDVAATLKTLKARNLKIGVASDIHFDLRPVFRESGLLGFVDAFLLSYEHGMQKPDPAIFAAALGELGTTANETLMVGDRASHDGGAVALGMPTLLLPPLTGVHDERLSLVVQITECPSPRSR